MLTIVPQDRIYDIVPQPVFFSEGGKSLPIIPARTTISCASSFADPQDVSACLARINQALKLTSLIC